MAMLNAIGSAGGSPERFAELGVAELPRLVDSELTTLSVCDLTTGRRRVTGAPGPKLSASAIAAFDRHFFAHPLVRFHSSHHDGGAHRISDSMGGAAFRATPLYNEYYRSIGIDHALAVPLYVDNETLVSFVLNRTRRDFTDDEVALFDQVRGWLGAMYRNALALRRATEAIEQLRAIAEGEDWAVVRLDGRRRIRELAPHAEAMLARACRGTKLRAGAMLPAVIDAWLTDVAGRNVPRLALSPLSLAGPHGQVTVRAMPELAGDAAWLLLVRGGIGKCGKCEKYGERGDAGERGATASAGNADGLTVREREILQWVGAGKTDRQVAGIVGLSHRTVQKHLEHIYVKLGVENRTAAVMRAAARQPADLARPD
jgi:DNA-binding CsgD family transcriptional regulator